MRSSPPLPAPGAVAELVPPWLKSLPLAPEFRPTAAEFTDPVSYILKIEPAAAPFGICKVVSPCPPPPKKAILSNLSRSFAALHPGDPAPSFPTRHQQLGLCPRRAHPALKPVWRSSHRYTLPQFETKAAASRKSLLARLNVPASKLLSPLDLEALFWRSSADRPVVVEYASDMPGSGSPLLQATAAGVARGRDGMEHARRGQEPRLTAAVHAGVGPRGHHADAVCHHDVQLVRLVRRGPRSAQPQIHALWGPPRRGMGFRAMPRSPSRRWCACTAMAGR